MLTFLKSPRHSCHHISHPNKRRLFSLLSLLNEGRITFCGKFTDMPGKESLDRKAEDLFSRTLIHT